MIVEPIVYAVHRRRSIDLLRFIGPMDARREGIARLDVVGIKRRRRNVSNMRRSLLSKDAAQEL